MTSHKLIISGATEQIPLDQYSEPFATEELNRAQQIDWVLKESGFNLLFDVGSGSYHVFTDSGDFVEIDSGFESVDTLDKLNETDNHELRTALQIEPDSERVRELTFSESVLGSNVNQIANPVNWQRAQAFARILEEQNEHSQLMYQFRFDVFAVVHDGMVCGDSVYPDLWSLYISDYHGLILSGMDLCDCGDFGFIVRDSDGDCEVYECHVCAPDQFDLSKVDHMAMNNWYESALNTNPHYTRTHSAT